MRYCKIYYDHLSQNYVVISRKFIICNAGNNLAQRKNPSNIEISSEKVYMYLANIFLKITYKNTFLSLEIKQFCNKTNKRKKNIIYFHKIIKPFLT